MYKIHTPSHRFDTQNLQIFAIFGKIRLIFQIFANVAEIAAKNVIFRWNFRRILPEFHRISAILIKQTILFSFQMNFEKNAATFAENLLFLAGRQSAKVPPSPWSRWHKFKQPRYYLISLVEKYLSDQPQQNVYHLEAAVHVVGCRVERFDRRPIELFELFTSEFRQNSCQNSGKIITFLQKILKFQDFSTFSRMFSEIPRKNHQNLTRIRWKLLKNTG